MKLEEMRANRRQVLVQVEKKEEEKGTLTFESAKESLVVGDVIHAGTKTGLQEFVSKGPQVKVIFLASAAINLGFGFKDVKFVDIDDVLAYVIPTELE